MCGVFGVVLPPGADQGADQVGRRRAIRRLDLDVAGIARAVRADHGAAQGDHTPSLAIAARCGLPSSTGGL
jgi:hypothetical protein